MTQPPDSRSQATLAGHVAIMRFDHWFKNVFVLPGVVVAVSLVEEWPADLLRNLLLGSLSIGLIASSNYVLNEVLDAPSDRHHPQKRLRPVPQGRVSIPWAYAQWIGLMLVGLAIAQAVSTEFTLVMVALFAMGCIYNLPPIRSKDRAYVDVLSEAVNNPIRMLAGWAMVETDAVAPASLLLSYWMIGCYFMAVKRYAELRGLAGADAAAYRRSFATYDETKLLTSILFYSAAAMLFFGVFVMRYRLELILSFPFVAFVMAVYLGIGLMPDSPAQQPEKLYRQGRLLGASLLCAGIMLVCLIVDMPWLDQLVSPMAPTR